MPLWQIAFVSSNRISWSRETFRIIADSPEHALRLARAELVGMYDEDENEPDNGHLESMSYICERVIEDSVPG